MGPGKDPADHYGRCRSRQEEEEGIGKRDAVRTKRVEEKDHAKTDGAGERTGKNGPAYRAKPDLEQVHSTAHESLADTDDRDYHAGEDTPDNRVKGNSDWFRVLQQVVVPGKKEDLKQPRKVDKKGNDQKTYCGREGI
jgi:hypothetical protein